MSEIAGGAGGTRPSIPGSSGNPLGPGAGDKPLGPGSGNNPLGGSGAAGQDVAKGRPDTGDGSKIGPGTGAEEGSEAGGGAGRATPPDPAKGPAGASEGASDEGTPSLGAGGTSEAAKDGPEGNMGSVAKGAGAAVAVPAVGVAGQLMIFMMFLKWLKSLMAQIAAMLLNWLNALWNLLIAFVKPLVGIALAVGGAIAALAGGAVSVAVGAVVSGTAVLMALVSVAVVVANAVTQGNSAAQHDALPPDCRPMTEATVREIDDNTRSANNSKAMDEMAEKLYSILSAWGMQDENIAGVLGNFEAESNIDPTTVETIYDEAYEIGPRTKAAEENGFKIELIDATYAEEWPAIELAGIGLGQWTNGRNKMLTDYAEKTGGKWSDLETQLSFMISDDDPTRVRFVKDLIEEPSGSISESTEDWMVEWEGLSLSVPANPPRLAERQELANRWFAKMDAWEADEELADSILEQAEATLGQANQNRRSAVIQDCRTANIGSGSVVQAGEQIPCDSLGAMHPHACAMHEHLQEEFGGFFLSAGGQRNEPGSNHHNGQAIDYMMADLGEVPSQEMYDSAIIVINHLIANSEELNISGILWDERKWAAGNDPVGEWGDEITRDAGGRGSNTQNHIDHIHVSVGPDPFM